MAFVLSQTVSASNIFRTNDWVNFRTGPSTSDRSLGVLDFHTSVEMLVHDPAGWSKVKHNGTEGFIRSDFLQYVISDKPAIFKTNDGVNFRTGPSTAHSAIRTVVTGTVVEMMEHDPAGWSKIKINGTAGFIRSDFLVWNAREEQPQGSAVQDEKDTKSVPESNVPENNAPESSEPDIDQSEEAPAEETPDNHIIIMRTSDIVNFRTGPSKDYKSMRTIRAGTEVEIIEYDPDGWSKVRHNDDEGYIKSEFLRFPAVAGEVELIDWSDMKDIIRTGVPLQVIDVRTGLDFTLQCFSKGTHADVEPLTSGDTAIILRTRNGAWSWDPRPVWVITGERTFAAALNGMPHDVSTISNNGMNGHLCLHFLGSTTGSTSASYRADLQNGVQEAWNAR